MDRCRFAPTTSGPAHPGTLLAGLLCWLDARSRGAWLGLRLEDIDHTRCTRESAADMRAALDWFGLDWDDVSLQTDRDAEHASALTHLSERGVIYPCRCSRSDVQRAGDRAADGGYRYPETCRDRALPDADWRGCGEVLRLRLEPGVITLVDEGGLDLSQDPAAAMGDPVLLRKDGAVTYHLAAVVDDAAQGVTRIVRGRDIAAATALHVTLQRLLRVATPAYRHHLLLLEERGEKLAKLHGAVAWHSLRNHYTPQALCGFLAHAVGLRTVPAAVTPRELLEDFDWARVGRGDPVLRWTGSELRAVGSRPAGSE